MAQLRRAAESIHQRGAELVFIGNGTQQFAAAFREDLSLDDTPLYLDTSCASYRAAGMRRGFARTLGAWRTWMNMGRAVLEGFGQRRIRRILRWWWWSLPAIFRGIHGDAWHLGGIVIVLPDGRIAYHYASIVAGDHPAVDDIIGALEAAKDSIAGVRPAEPIAGSRTS